jgi:hypothetical protein
VVAVAVSVTHNLTACQAGGDTGYYGGHPVPPLKIVGGARFLKLTLVAAFRCWHNLLSGRLVLAKL